MPIFTLDVYLSDSLSSSSLSVMSVALPVTKVFPQDELSSISSRSSVCFDDSMVDYLSMLGREDRQRRFSEDVVDTGVKDTVRLKKLYRQLQRQVHCNQISHQAVPNLFIKHLNL